MQRAIALADLGRPEARRGWVTRLGVASIVFGSLGALAGALMTRDAWSDVTDPTIRWLYPPPHWVCPALLVAIIAEVVTALALLAAGVTSLVKPAMTARIHILAPSAVLLAVMAICALHVLQNWPNPSLSSLDRFINTGGLFAILGTYPVVALCVVLRRARALRSGPAAA